MQHLVLNKFSLAKFTLTPLTLWGLGQTITETSFWFDNLNDSWDELLDSRWDKL